MKKADSVEVPYMFVDAAFDRVIFFKNYFLLNNLRTYLCYRLAPYSLNAEGCAAYLETFGYTPPYWTTHSMNNACCPFILESVLVERHDDTMYYCVAAESIVAATLRALPDPPPVGYPSVVQLPRTCLYDHALFLREVALAQRKPERLRVLRRYFAEKKRDAAKGDDALVSLVSD